MALDQMCVDTLGVAKPHSLLDANENHQQMLAKVLQDESCDMRSNSMLG